MTSLGFHYFPDLDHYRAADLQAWRPELKALGAQWLTVLGSARQAVPEPFLRGLIEAGIEPVVHIPLTPLRAVDVAALRPLLATYERWGLKHVVLFSEPNARAAWAPSEWSRSALVERFLDLLAPALAAQIEAGLQPTFPPLKAEGEYWDTAFLEACLVGLQRRGLEELARSLTFAVNLWTFNRPVAWGAGGLRRWPEAHPYRTPPGMQDQRGFHLFDWYTEIIEARLGQPRPLLCLAGGPRLGDRTDPQNPPVDEARHASCIRDIVQAQASGQLPRNLLNINFWLLGAAPGSAHEREGWFRPDGATLPAVDILRSAAEAARTAQPAAGKSAKSRGLEHYLLLPVFEWGASDWHWHAAWEFVRAHQPAVGFSPDEARQAQRVTIFGNEQGISRETEAALRQAGCRVQRITPAAKRKA